MVGRRRERGRGEGVEGKEGEGVWSSLVGRGERGCEEVPTETRECVIWSDSKAHAWKRWAVSWA